MAAKSQQIGPPSYTSIFFLHLVSNGDQPNVMANQFSVEKTKFVINFLNSANILIAGRTRTSTHRRQDHCEALCAIRTGHTAWLWSDQRLEQEFNVALTKWDEKNTPSEPEEDSAMIRTILAEMRKRKNDDKSSGMDRFRCLQYKPSKLRPTPENPSSAKKNRKVFIAVQLLTNFFWVLVHAIFAKKLKKKNWGEIPKIFFSIMP